MQRDLDQLQRKKRRKRGRKGLLVIIGVSMVAALTLVGMRMCSEQYGGEEYNKGYRPMDTDRLRQTEQ